MTFQQQAELKSSPLENFQAFFNIAGMVLQRNNPVVNMLKQVQYMFYVMLTIRQKLNIVKQRVNHMKYRLHQMEQLIDQNNAHSFTKGSTLNQLR